MKHQASTCFVKLRFSVACCVLQCLKLRKIFTLNTIIIQYSARTVPFSAPFVVKDIISEKDCTWLFPEAKPCLRMWSVPQDWSQRTYYQIRLARETCWMSIIVHCWGFHHCNPSTSAATLRGEMKRERYSPYVSLQRAQRRNLVESVAWANNSSALPQPEKEQKIRPSCYPGW